MYIAAGSLKEFLRFYPVVSFLLVINVLLFILTTVPIFPNQLIFEKTAGVNVYIKNGELWRLITPIFIHSHFSHLLFNIVALFLFGPVLESVSGKWKLLFLFLSSGIFANFITFIFAPPAFVHVGASGAIFGMFGALLILAKMENIPHIEFKYLLIVVSCAVLYSFLQKEVNVYAHIGGLVGGSIFGYFFFSKQQS